MTRHYTIKAFFRQAPNKLLARLFHKNNLLNNIDFKSIKETQLDPIFVAWQALPEHNRKAIETEFQSIFDLSCEKGTHAILDEARWQMRDNPEKLAIFVSTLSALPSHAHRAIVTYLDHSECWKKGATRFFHADNLSYWRKRKNMGHQPAAVDDNSIQQLENQLRDYFHNAEGRGKNCIVEVYRRGGRDYFFAYPEDFSQQNMEWVDGEFNRRPHNPAFEVIFIYSQEEGTLDLYLNGPKKAVEALQTIFAMAILKLKKLPPNPKDERIYNLNPLREKNFSFAYSPGSGIEYVAIKKMTLSSRINYGDSVTVGANSAENPVAIYSHINRVINPNILHLYNVTWVEIMTRIRLNHGESPKTITIRISHPNSCSLKYDEPELKLRKMLEASGIEAKEPVTDTTKPVEPIEA